MHRSNQNLVVPLSENIDENEAEQLAMEILENIRKYSIKGVLIDVSTVKSMDSYIFSIFKETAKMISLMGARPVFAGIQPGSASALVDLGIDCDDVYTTVSIDDGMKFLSELSK